MRDLGLFANFERLIKLFSLSSNYFERGESMRSYMYKALNSKKYVKWFNAGSHLDVC